MTTSVPGPHPGPSAPIDRGWCATHGAWLPVTTTVCDRADDPRLDDTAACRRVEAPAYLDATPWCCERCGAVLVEKSAAYGSLLQPCACGHDTGVRHDGTQRRHVYLPIPAAGPTAEARLAQITRERDAATAALDAASVPWLRATAAAGTSVGPGVGSRIAALAGERDAARGELATLRELVRAYFAAEQQACSEDPNHGDFAYFPPALRTARCALDAAVSADGARRGPDVG